jgi:cytochrome c oxidase cbb3-type subunit 3
MWKTLILACGLIAAPALGDAGSTRQLFVEKCSICHGADASGSDRGPALVSNPRLRTRSVADIESIIRKGTPGGMPAFALRKDQLDNLAGYIRSLNVTAFDAKPEGDLAVGKAFFFGAGHCSSCHTAQGLGGSTGPDLSNIARQLTLPELESHSPTRPRGLRRDTALLTWF